MRDEHDLLKFDTASEFLIGEGLPRLTVFVHVFLDSVVVVILYHLLDQRCLEYQNGTLRGCIFQLERSIGGQSVPMSNFRDQRSARKKMPEIVFTHPETEVFPTCLIVVL